MRKTGHIRQRSSGSWELRYALQRDRAAGKRKLVTLTVRGTRKDAEKELRRLLRTMDTEEHVDPTNITVGDWLNKWLDTVRDEISPKSHERYTELVENYLTAELGSLRLAKLSPVHIQTAYSRWAVSGRRDGKEGGLSPATRRYLHRLLRASLARAVEHQLIARNPADVFRARLAKIERKELATLSEAQSADLIAALAGTRLFWPVLIALGTGMRRGEILALRWRNVDLERSEIRVVESLEQTKSGLRAKSPKTEKARSVALPRFVVDQLRAHRKAELERLLGIGVRLSAATPVCCAVDGSYTLPRTLTHAFARALSRVRDIPKVRFHDLRHSHATQLLAAGVHPKVAQERLGHSTISTTLDLYSHVSMTMQQQVAEGLDAGLGRAISSALARK